MPGEYCMDKMSIFQSEESGFMESDPGSTGIDGDRTGVQYRFHHVGNNGTPYLLEVRLPPGHMVLPHAHETGEIVAVVEGELDLDNKVLGPGSSVYIPAYTLNAFRAGPSGCRFLDFRATADETMLSAEDLVD